jgi:hypothetical protein
MVERLFFPKDGLRQHKIVNVNAIVKRQLSGKTLNKNLAMTVGKIQ